MIDKFNLLFWNTAHAEDVDIHAVLKTLQDLLDDTAKLDDVLKKIKIRPRQKINFSKKLDNLQKKIELKILNVRGI